MVCCIYLKSLRLISSFLALCIPIKLSLCRILISAIPDLISGTILRSTFSLIGAPDMGNISLLKEIFLYGFTVLWSLRANMSFEERYGVGSTNPLNRDLPSSESLLSLQQGTSPVTECLSGVNYIFPLQPLALSYHLLSL